MKLPEGFTTDFEGLADALACDEATVSVRFNPRRCNALPEGLCRVPWCAMGAELKSRPQFTFDPAMHQGVYYVQDASSMIHSYLVAQLTAGMKPLLCLDACAAPGGKTTAALDSLPEGSFMLANEYVAARSEALAQNLTRWGSPMTAVSQGDTDKLGRLHEMFSLIIADVPCSGEGMFRKDPEAVRQWSPRLVDDCVKLQKEITSNLWKALKPGGFMIYSTCTFNRKENQEMVEFMVDEFGDAEAVEIELPDEWNVVHRGSCLHFLPGRVHGEGLTVAVVRKKGELKAGSKPNGKNREKAITGAVADAATRWIGNNSDYAIRQYGDTFYAQPRQWENEIKTFNAKLKMVSPGGIEFAQVKGRDVVPQQGLALSTAIAENAFTRFDVDYATAIAYLQRQALQLPDSAPRGLLLLTYGGIPLGFVKNLGNRANNLYPAQWRILSTHVPDIPPTLYADSQCGDETSGERH